MTKKQKRMLLRILVTLVVYAVLLVGFGVIPGAEGLPWWGALLCYLVPYGVIGWDVLLRAGRNIAHGQVFDENFLMIVATIGAFAVGEYKEAVAVMLFYQVGEWFQDYAVNRSRQSIAALMDICPEYANLMVDGVLTQVDPEDVEVGARIVVKPGERVPLDGTVVEGSSMLDTSALTGESVPRAVKAGEPIISGCVNGGGLLTVEVTHAFEDSTVTRILELVENASERKATVENFITRFARYYTPVVVIGAVLLAILPPLFLHLDWMDCIQRACIFLVISCPCALVISVPMSFFGGIGAASKNGILVKGGNFLESVSQLDTVVFDKTGTLTQGTFSVTEVYAQDGAQERLLQLAALAEHYSDHPIARSICAACPDKLDFQRVTGAEELPGRGIRAQVDGKPVLAGNLLLMQSAGLTVSPCQAAGTVVYLAQEGTYLGYVRISDQVRPDAAEAIAQLKAAGIRTVMLTGDRAETAQAVAQALGMDEFHAQLLPADKVERVEGLLAQQTKGRTLGFVGDGINDAPVLARADVGIAMGGMGSDAAIEAADIVLMDDSPSKLPQIIRIGRKTMIIARQNIVFALGVKLVILVLGALGIANMWLAVFADVGVAVLAILNAMRALNAK